MNRLMLALSACQLGATARPRSRGAAQLFSPLTKRGGGGRFGPIPKVVAGADGRPRYRWALRGEAALRDLAMVPRVGRVA